MGRELRRVIPNWEHPKRKRYDYVKRMEVEEFQPMFDKSYIEAITEWIKNHTLWEQGKYPDQDENYKYYADMPCMRQ